MEFRYKKTKLDIIAFFIGLILLISSISWIVKQIIEFGRPPQNLDLLYISVIFFIPAYYGFKFYRSEGNAVITMNDTEVIYISKGKTTKIHWSEVNKVYFKEAVQRSGVTSILIEGNSQEIIIGSRIENFSKIIQFVKNKVGDKFNTFDIPLDLKLTKIT